MPPASLRGARYDVVVDWIAFTVNDIERDLAWFSGKPEAASVDQLVFISSASAYQKPPVHPVITRNHAAREPVHTQLAAGQLANHLNMARTWPFPGLNCVPRRT